MLQYREATAEDLPGICVLGAEVNLVHHTACPDVFSSEVPLERQTEVWKASLGKEGSTIFVAEQAAQLVGFVTATLVDEASPLFKQVRYARVGSIGVSELNRGHGIGRKLMQLVETWAHGHGASEVHLNVWSFNERARHLYEELGYAVRVQYMAKRLPTEA